MIKHDSVGLGALCGRSEFQRQVGVFKKNFRKPEFSSQQWQNFKTEENMLRLQMKRRGSMADLDIVEGEGGSVLDRKMGMTQINRLRQPYTDGLRNLDPEIVQVEGCQEQAADRYGADEQDQAD